MLRRVPIGGAPGSDPFDTSARQGLPFRIDVDASPLAALAQSAAVGCRLYEFMSIHRPGDVLRYLWVHLVDLPDDLIKYVRSSVKHQRRFNLWELSREDVATLIELPFVEFDRCFWRQESDCLDDEMDDVHRRWIDVRRSGSLNRMAGGLLDAVRAIQMRVRQGADALAQQEISLIDRAAHRRDFWAHRVLVGRPVQPPSGETTLPPALLTMITELVRQPDVKSVSCALTDYALWRALATEQLVRSRTEGIALQDALYLAGPDSGIPDVIAADWGVNIHIPWEGVCGGDLFVVPDWFSVDRHAAAEKGTVRGGLGDRDCRYVLSKRPLGNFENDASIVCEGWTLYSPR